MIIESEKDLRGIRRIGEICGLTLKLMLDSAEAGMSTRDLDDIGRDFLTKAGALSAPIQAYEFPGYTCISLNDEAAHGIPRKDRRIQPGDLLNVDVSAILEGYYGDTGATIILPPARDDRRRLCATTRHALALAIDMARPGQRANRIGRALDRFARRHGYRTLRQLGGHGVGRAIHEKPSIPNFYQWTNRAVLKDGMVVTLEPFLTAGRGRLKTDADTWTLRTTDGGDCAQYEHTVVINGDAPLLATRVDGGYV